MSETTFAHGHGYDRRADDPRINNHDTRIGGLEVRVTRNEDAIANMAPKVEVVELVGGINLQLSKLAGDIQAVTRAMENFSTAFSTQLGELAKQTQRQAEINNEQMREAGKAAKEKHEAEIAALKQQLEEGRPVNKAKTIAIYLGLILSFFTLLGTVGGALVWWVQIVMKGGTS